MNANFLNFNANTNFSPFIIYLVIAYSHNNFGRCFANKKFQKPFSRLKGFVTSICFHPKKPHFFVATKKYVRIYDLAGHRLIKKIITGTDWLSCMRIDSSGDNLFIGGLDRRFSWIDLQLSNKPWKNIRHHTAAIRDIAAHHRFFLKSFK